jgi:uncharacterized protein YjbJ (UPF0337 family)
VGELIGNKDRELQGQVEITNGSNKKDRADWQDNVRKGADRARTIQTIRPTNESRAIKRGAL